MFGPDVTFLGVERCDLVLKMLSGIAYRRAGGTWESIPAMLLEGRG